MVYNDELNEEIRRAENRLYYLRSRKRLGKPMGTTGVYVNRMKINRPRKKEDELQVFYREHVLDGSFKKDYVNLYENMIKHTKTFVSFHNNVFRSVEKHGNNKQKEMLKSMLKEEHINLLDNVK